MPAKAKLKSKTKPLPKAPAASKPAGIGLAALEKKVDQILALLEKGSQGTRLDYVKAPPQAAGASLESGPETDTGAFLSRTPLLAKLSPQECSIFANHCESKTIQSTEVLFSEGDFGDAMYIVKSGALEIFKKDLLGHVRIAEIRPGGLVGEMALVDGKPRSANVKASENARLLSLSRASYNDLKKAYPQVATKFQDELLLLISSRLRQTTEKLVGK